MKKLLIFLVIFISTTCVANANEMHQQLKFLYINGANNNTPVMQKWFFDGIAKLHPDMKHEFETSPFVRKKLLNDGNLIIDKEPEIFFWGNKTLSDLETLNQGLVSTSMISPKLAQMVRSIFAHCMHDAIWVQKDHNMQIMVNELHTSIMDAYSKNQKVILFGYSAGSFITYRYMFYKLPAISWESLTGKLDLPADEKKFVQQHKINPTCIDAITSSGLAVYSTSGILVPNANFEMFKKSYTNLNQTTRDVCIPNGTVLGIVNYASPLVLFYSDIKDPTIEINQYNGDIFKFMKNENIFWITVNFADDPLGYPLAKNLTQSEISDLHKIQFKPEGRGFFHDKSDVKSPATFLGAHTSYWKYSKKFSKAVVNAYKEGYINFYPEKIDDYE